MERRSVLQKPVCGRTKGPKRHKETWWWNEQVSVAVRSFCSGNGLKPGLVNHGKNKDTRQYAKKVEIHAKAYKKRTG